jgi:hypothetical protein
MEWRTIMKKLIFVLGLTVYTAMVCVGVAFAQAPVVNIDKYRHGNLASAQNFIVQAYQKISDAQTANNDQLGGHAARAKNLLVQADEELRLAADVANDR